MQECAPVRWPIYIHRDQVAKLMLIKCTHCKHKDDQLVYRMEDCISLKCLISDPGEEPQRWETRECCFERFSPHEACNPHGPGKDGCEVPSKSYFKAAAKHWRWCSEGQIDPRSADSPGVGRLVARPSSVNALRVAIDIAPELQERLERTTSPR